MRSTTGIVIKRQHKGEHDELLTVYTRKYGKLSVVARGVRKQGAKLAGHTGLFCLSEIGFVEGARQNVLTSAKAVEQFSGVKADVAKFQAARRIAELVDLYTFLQEKDESMFHLIVGACDYLHRRQLTPLELKFFLRYFEFKFLSTLGYEPEDKTIMHAFDGDRFVLSERELDRITDVFEKHFASIYSKV